MPISGLVVTLSDNESEREQALDDLSSDSRITVGECQKNRLPVVVETADIGSGSRLVREELVAIDGVIFVDVVSVNFEDVTKMEDKE